MSTKYYDSGSRMVTITYEVRVLDSHGDAIDVRVRETLADAILDAERMMSRDAAAVVIEKHTARRPSHIYDIPDSHRTVAQFGDKSAIAAWAGEDGQL